MCGIVGYIGPKKVVPVVIEGLRKLEYRGYDSAGIAVVGADGKLDLRRASGKLRNLEEVIQKSPLEGTYGIGHTRWATHGRPTEENAHPHRDCTGQIVVVHNGIIENYLELKEQLQREGHKFVTETDTEIVAHLVEKNSQGGVPLEDAVRKSLNQLRGIYALVFMSSRDPHKIVAARMGPPAVIGLGENEFFVASDIPALLEHTRNIFFLADGDIAVLTKSGVHVMDHDGKPVERKPHHVAWDPIMAEKGGYKHFMQKEIFEQPRAVRDTLLSSISRDTGKTYLGDLGLTEQQFRTFDRVRIVACGTSWHAGLAGKFMIERLARIPVEVDYGSEFRYRDPILDARTLTVCISQSGETADTIAAQREAKHKGSPTIAICNVIGSMITREAVGSIITHAGPEIGVASTKAFTSQLTALLLLAMHLGETRGALSGEAAKTLLQEFARIPHKMETILQYEESGLFEALARQFFRCTDFLYLGRGIHYPIALEGALKLKEISYIHAEGYPAGEMKHGPNALIDENLPVVVLATRDESDPASVTLYEKSVSNMQEVRARDGIVIAIVTAGDHLARSAANHVITLPPAPELLAPLLEIIPLQLLSYHIAVRRGCDVDQPRNLAKSVTVE
ncbi:MAG TPA: glutamine--fructose-6-phosphate transaminase (isomerizing) [Candidatus Dormibacteraeota bacterium]|jgi:glucosamine--fructose-6-phosphate aminotransferase (isomerizing)|nr:glutamine--fructose-6-phosphate transaminase (isomerizing) [Candidatus Dormibacteraeota bacterium]